MHVRWIASLTRIICFCGLLVCVWRPQSVLAGVCSEKESYRVQWGDTLSIIARRFGRTTGDLMGLNGIDDPNRIYAGRVLSLGVKNNCLVESMTSHEVRRGETLWRIATIYGTTVTEMANANGVSDPRLIYTGQRLIVPVLSRTEAELVNEFSTIQLSTRTPVQGRVLVLSLGSDEISDLSGSFGPWMIRFYHDDGRYVGLVGSYALADPTVYTLTVEGRSSDGQVIRHSDNLFLSAGVYGYESIVLSANKTGLLSPTKTVSEQQMVSAVVTAETQDRLWDGVFRVPAAGYITSSFGTRRSFNGGPYNSYHGGVDFSSLAGPSIFASAAGRVVFVESLEVRGNTTIIDHGWGVYSAYLHQSDVFVHVGAMVQPGQVIGHIGATGLVTGPHLHWEMYVGGVQVDPIQWTELELP